MYPVIFSFGFFTFYTINIFLFLATFSALFIFWYKVKEDGLFDEIETFDWMLLSAIFGFGIGRMVFILLNLEIFQSNFIMMFQIFSYPGINILAYLISSASFMFYFSSKRKKDRFEILDFWSLALSGSLIFYYLGLFFSGNMIGKSSNFIFALQFGNNLDKKHPITLYFTVFYFLLWLYLLFLEKRYRHFIWYRNGKQSGKSGFLFVISIILTSLFSLFMLFFWQGEFFVSILVLDWFFYLILFFYGLFLLLIRSNRLKFKLWD